MTSKIVPGYELQVERLPRGKNRKLLRHLKVRNICTTLTTVTVKHLRPGGGSNGAVDGSAGTIDVFSGFTTDYSSIPTLLHWFVSWWKVDVAGVVHDFLYRDTNCPRDTADAVWRELALSGRSCASSFQAWVCWVMLRGFGGWSKPYPHEHRVVPFLFAVFLAAVLLLFVFLGLLAIVALLFLPVVLLAAAALLTLPVVAIALPIGFILMR